MGPGITTSEVGRVHGDHYDVHATLSEVGESTGELLLWVQHYTVRGGKSSGDHYDVHATPSEVGRVQETIMMFMPHRQRWEEFRRPL
ncbi:hypothetical protein RRG08_056441 [Elysia crispata]|uniref:Uncharacterized protein n=1 Tax=Elysia crispata TaxID=231223 RepID=A0AAE1CPS5_9GAST|nr:hypothetical protein RRG08_056441 [Elysia crispata]